MKISSALEQKINQNYPQYIKEGLLTLRWYSEENSIGSNPIWERI